jgi:hypothetical protein
VRGRGQGTAGGPAKQYDAVHAYLPNNNFSNKARVNVNLETIIPISDAIIVLPPSNENLLVLKNHLFHVHTYITRIKTSDRNFSV